MHQVALLLREVAKDEKARNEIIEAANQRIYGHQDILFRDLFGFSGRGKRASNLKISGFVEAFKAAKGNMAKNSRDNTRLSTEPDKIDLSRIEEWLAENKMVIYAPMFSLFKEFNIDINDITVTFHPLVQDTLNYGYKIDLQSGQKTLVEKVNKAYVEEHPTWVIMPAENYERGYQQEDAFPLTLENKRTDGGDPTPIGSPENNTRYIDCRQVASGSIVDTKFLEFRMTSDWDSGLFGGDTEVTILRASGDITFTNGAFVPSASTYTIWQDETIPYDDIKRMRTFTDLWFSSNVPAFDDNWKVEETEQKLLILDDDTGNFTFEGEVGVGYKDGKPSVDAKVNVKYKDSKTFNNGDIKFYNTIDRCSYLASANKDDAYGITQPQRSISAVINIGPFKFPVTYQGGTLSPGWKIYNVDGFQFYLPFKIYK
jgi:hypothetical protein